jgi:hypothetical protein
VSQAAALCGVTIHQLAEWTDLGYVHAIGRGERRFYNRESLRQIIALRRSFESNPRRGEPDAAFEARKRPEEFPEFEGVPSDELLALQIQMFFVLNPAAPQTVASLAERFHVGPERACRVIQTLVNDGSVEPVQTPQGPGFVAARLTLQGPRVREQRIRATRRRRKPARTEDTP